jgi:hypothetical protein
LYLGGGTVQSVPKNRASAPAVLVPRQYGPIALAADLGQLYWVTSVGAGTLRRCALSSCATPETLADSEPAPAALVVEPGVVYWVNQGLLGGPGAVRRRSTE